MNRRRTIRRLGTAAAFIAGCCCPSLILAGRDTEVARQNPSALPEAARNTLDILRWGDPAAQREAAEEAAPVFRFLETTAGEDAGFREVLVALTRTIRTGRDDWVTSRLLQNLGELDAPGLNPLFIEALENRSPNIRWRAIQWFAEHESVEALPYLEKAWRSERRPWVRIDLLAALAGNGAVGFGPELVEVAERGSPSLSRAAFEALQAMGDPGIVRDLARLAREGEDRVRKEAVASLTAWPESEEALAAVLEATRAEDPGVRERAIASLGQFLDARAVERVLELAGSGARPADRRAALTALEPRRPKEAVPVLAELLHETLPPESPDLHREAIWILFQMDDAAAVPLLRNLDPTLGGPGPHNLQGLLENLSRDRSVPSRRRHWFRTSVGEDIRIGDPENPVEFVVVAQDGRLTIRCWEFPGVAGDPLFFERIPSGGRVEATDHYEGEDESWLQVESPNSTEDCWVPRRLLEPLSEEGDPEEPGETPGRREFDLPATDLGSAAARRLMEARLLKVIEPGEDVVGLVLEIDPDNEEGLAILQASCPDDDSILDLEIGEVLRTLRRACPGEAEEASAEIAGSPDGEDPPVVLVDY